MTIGNFIALIALIALNARCALRSRNAGLCTGTAR